MLPPLKYHLQTVRVRWRSTLATLASIALVVMVYLLVQSLAAGLDAIATQTGDMRNLMVLRRGSIAESSSLLTIDQIRTAKHLQGIAKDKSGAPLASVDTLVVVNHQRRDGKSMANVLFRGISQAGIELRQQVQLVEGRWFAPGRREAVASTKLRDRMAGMEIGNEIKIGADKLKIVGLMDGQGSAFDSELWLDSEEAKGLFNRDFYSSVLLRLEDGADQKSLISRLDTDKRLQVRGILETDYYREQTKTAGPIRFLGNFLAAVMSVGAVVASTNSMYAFMGKRTREIGTLRVLGFRRRTILAGLLFEGVCIGFCGGLIGCVLALPVHGLSTGTMAFESFTEVVFHFQITLTLVARAMAFAVFAGLTGSLLPALRATRMPVVDALKSA